jgi:hypothetical protein
MLSQDTGDCLALANTAILMRLIQNLTERNIIAQPRVLLVDAVSDLENCPEQSSRIAHAVRLISKELMPRLAGAAQVG